MSIIWITGGMCLENLTREMSRGYPNQLPGPAHLARLIVEEQRFYPEPLPDWASNPDTLQGTLVSMIWILKEGGDRLSGPSFVFGLSSSSSSTSPAPFFRV